MATVRFAHICDHCGKRGQEYSAMPTCSECLMDTCGNCAEPETCTEDESNQCVCRSCAEIARAWTDRANALAFAALPSEITEQETPATPFDEEKI